VATGTFSELLVRPKQLGLCPEPRWGSLHCSPDTFACCPLSKNLLSALNFRLCCWVSWTIETVAKGSVSL